MTDQPTPEKIKAFLDDLARLSVKHDLFVSCDLGSNETRIERLSDWDTAGYCATSPRPLGSGGGGGGGSRYSLPGDIWPGVILHSVPSRSLGNAFAINSLDITQLSAHERIKIMGGQG